jgi:hypothetical protein
VFWLLAVPLLIATPRVLSWSGGLSEGRQPANEVVMISRSRARPETGHELGNLSTVPGRA